jgi:competence protein ComEC
MTLEMIFWDVQLGNATYIKTPKPLHIVKDLGVGSYSDNNDTFSPLTHLMSEGVRQLDYVIISHPHKDHIEDILNFDKLSPKVLLRPKHLKKEDVMKDVKEKDEKIFEKYFEINDRYTAPVESEENPSTTKNNGGVEIQNFLPKKCSVSNINNHSIVTIIKYAESKILIPGDNEKPSWEELFEMDGFKSAIKNVDILVAPHHGRESGYNPDLFDYFTPKLTIISDGKVCDTSAVDRYSKVSNGWTVKHRKNNNEKEKRNCVTTRNDGVIVVKFGYNNSEKPFISVHID